MAKTKKKTIDLSISISAKVFNELEKSWFI